MAQVIHQHGGIPLQLLHATYTRERGHNTTRVSVHIHTLILPGNGSVVAQESENSKFYIQLGGAISNYIKQMCTDTDSLSLSDSLRN